jgi:alkanesulfonate monooxygenase SsuD/methylene tetrahydromethanopterin reductase-like flavin-dependent oxidoreductase (luciferase family)
MDREFGRIGPLLPPDQALSSCSPAEEIAIERLKANALVGSAPRVADKLQALAQRLEVDEVVVITWTHDAQAQRRSYELLAQAMGLSQAPAQAEAVSA